MADNITIKDAAAADVVVRATDNSGIFTPHQNAQLFIAGTAVSGGNPVPISGALTDTQLRATAVPVSGTVSTGGLTDVQLRATAVPTVLNGTSNAGTMAALNATVPMSINGVAGVAIDLRGTFSATVTFQGSIDGTNFFSLVAIPVASTQNTALVSTATAAGAWLASCAGMVQVRCIATAYTSGTINATLRAVTATPFVYQAPVGATNAIAGAVTLASTILAAGSAAIGDVGQQYRANNTGAASFISFRSPVTPAATSIKATTGRLLAINLCNTAATTRWVKFFAVASVTMGTTAAVWERPIPPNGSMEFNMEGGIGYGTAMQIAVTSAAGLTDNTATGLALADVTGFVAFA